MNQNQHYDNLCAAAAHFGLAAQVEKTVEEARELVTELLYWRETGTPRENTVAEIADVYNMLDQLCILMDWEEQAQTAAEAKMERTIERYGISSQDAPLISYLIEMRNSRTGRVEQHRTEAASRNELEPSLRAFREAGYEILHVGEVHNEKG